MIVLDTNVVSELIRPGAEPRVVRWVDAHPAAEVALTSITVAELLFGVARIPDSVRKPDLGHGIEALVDEDFGARVLDFDARAAAAYAGIVAARERRGRPMSALDGQIAAICASRGAALATRNVRDFEDTGIDVVDPWSAP